MTLLKKRIAKKFEKQEPKKERQYGKKPQPVEEYFAKTIAEIAALREKLRNAKQNNIDSIQK